MTDSMVESLIQAGGEEAIGANKLVKKSKRYLDEKRWALAYVCANEAYELVQPKLIAATAAMRAMEMSMLPLLKPIYLTVSVQAESARQQALYKVIPPKWRFDVAQNLLEHAEKCIKEGKHLGEAVRFCTAAYQLNIKKPASLRMRARAFTRMGCHDLAYVDINEALEFTRGGGGSSPLMDWLQNARKKLRDFKPKNNPHIGGFTTAQLVAAIQDHTAFREIAAQLIFG